MPGELQVPRASGSTTAAQEELHATVATVLVMAQMALQCCREIALSQARCDGGDSVGPEPVVTKLHSRGKPLSWHTGRLSLPFQRAGLAAGPLIHLDEPASQAHLNSVATQAPAWLIDLLLSEHSCNNKGWIRFAQADLDWLQSYHAGKVVLPSCFTT